MILIVTQGNADHGPAEVANARRRAPPRGFTSLSRFTPAPASDAAACMNLRRSIVPLLFDDRLYLRRSCATAHGLTRYRPAVTMRQRAASSGADRSIIRNRTR